MVQICQKHLDFIPKIYDATTNPENWVSVLREFAAHCGAADSQLVLKDSLNSELFLRPRSFRYDPEIVALIDERSSADEAGAFQVVSQYPVQIWVTEELAYKKPFDEIPTIKLSKELVGLERSVALRLNSSAIWFDGLTLHFKVGRGNITDDEVTISQIFLPHIAKAVEISRPFLLLKQRFNAILSVIDRLQIGFVITNQNAEIIICNREAEEMLATDNGLSQTGNKKLHSRSNKIQALLTQQIFAAANTDAPSCFEAVISVPKRTGNMPWLLEVFPLVNFDGEIDQLFQGTAIFITDPENNRIISTKGMEQLFGLTKAERNICELIAKGYRTADVAEERNATLHTVRSQIKSLFQKTATSNQVDLVRLALKVNLPVERKEPKVDRDSEGTNQNEL